MREDLLLDVTERVFGVSEARATALGDPHDVTATIGGIALTLGESLLLEAASSVRSGGPR